MNHNFPTPLPDDYDPNCNRSTRPMPTPPPPPKKPDALAPGIPFGSIAEAVRAEREYLQKIFKAQHGYLMSLVGNDDDCTDGERKIQALAYQDAADIIRDRMRDSL